MKAPGTLLGLDLAQRYGVAVVDHMGRYVFSTCGILLGASRQRRRLELHKAICDLVDEFECDWIAIEKPINAGRMSSYETLRSLYGYADVAEDVAAVRELGFVDLARSTCCKAFLSNGNAGKPEGLAWAQQFKPSMASFDESDAVLVAMAAARFRGEARTESTVARPVKRSGLRASRSSPVSPLIPA